MANSIYKIAEAAELQPIAVDMIGFERLTTISQSKGRELVREGKVPHKRIGTRIVFSVDALREWLRDGQHVE